MSQLAHTHTLLRLLVTRSSRQASRLRLFSAPSLPRSARNVLLLQLRHPPLKKPQLPKSSRLTPLPAHSVTLPHPQVASSFPQAPPCPLYSAPSPPQSSLSALARHRAKTEAPCFLALWVMVPQMYNPSPASSKQLKAHKSQLARLPQKVAHLLPKTRALLKAHKSQLAHLQQEPAHLLLKTRAPLKAHKHQPARLLPREPKPSYRLSISCLSRQLFQLPCLRAPLKMLRPAFPARMRSRPAKAMFLARAGSQAANLQSPAKSDSQAVLHRFPPTTALVPPFPQGLRLQVQVRAQRQEPQAQMWLHSKVQLRRWGVDASVSLLFLWLRLSCCCKGDLLIYVSIWACSAY